MALINYSHLPNLVSEILGTFLEGKHHLKVSKGLICKLIFLKLPMYITKFTTSLLPDRIFSVKVGKTFKLVSIILFETGSFCKIRATLRSSIFSKYCRLAAKLETNNAASPFFRRKRYFDLPLNEEPIRIYIFDKSSKKAQFLVQIAP